MPPASKVNDRIIGQCQGILVDDYNSKDADGNMITDNNKNITSITYNHPSPTKITFATGNALSIFITL
jgi:hypothetical protein